MLNRGGGCSPHWDRRETVAPWVRGTLPRRREAMGASQAQAVAVHSRLHVLVLSASQSAQRVSELRMAVEKRKVIAIPTTAFCRYDARQAALVSHTPTPDARYERDDGRPVFPSVVNRRVGAGRAPDTEHRFNFSRTRAERADAVNGCDGCQVRCDVLTEIGKTRPIRRTCAGSLQVEIILCQQPQRCLRGSVPWLDPHARKLFSGKLTDLGVARSKAELVVEPPGAGLYGFVVVLAQLVGFNGI